LKITAAIPTLCYLLPNIILYPGFLAYEADAIKAEGMTENEIQECRE